MASALEGVNGNVARLYGVTSYAVSRRRTELGIRMALGSAPGGVVRLVLQRVALLVGLGVVVGAGVAWYAAKFVSTLLYGVQPRDVVTLAAAAGVLIAIGGLAAGSPPAAPPASIPRSSYASSPGL